MKTLKAIKMTKIELEDILFELLERLISYYEIAVEKKIKDRIEDLKEEL